MRIRATTEADWEALRDIRLRALEDAPYAFGSTIERERSRTEAEWREWAGRGRWANGVTFVATEGDRFLGLAGGFPEEGEPDAVHLVSMWVDPSVRRAGVGCALIDTVVGWAHDRGARSVHLWVADGNDAAIALYRSCGFEPSGTRQPLPSNTAVDEELYHRSLTGVG
ncbi:MAG: GNAT family N-acetyltransferase [Actinomycetota bacterium]